MSCIYTLDVLTMSFLVRISGVSCLINGVEGEKQVAVMTLPNEGHINEGKALNEKVCPNVRPVLHICQNMYQCKFLTFNHST